MIVVLCILLLSIGAAVAQDAEDFTVTDYQGNSYSLYSLLDAGNYVALHFTSTI
ncbi:MAG: hypothetical protein ACQEQ4_03850 [Fibrobacterota bacterium]